MAYTYDQLVLAYTAAHDGIGPDAATQATFQIQAVQSANGQQTDAQLLGNIVNGADSTTGLAVLAYQFFTGKSPTKAGIDYLVNSATNTSDLNDPYYSKFSLENRYINFAANLGVAGEGAANFAAKYGALSFSDYVASIYQTIIGASYATAAGIDATKAIADIISRKDAILATATGAGMISANATAAQIDIALKAATAGYLLGEAIKADVGLYAAAANNFMVAVVQGTATYNTDITYTYQPAVGTPSHGTGHALDNAPANLPTPAPVVDPVSPPPPVSHTFTLTAGTDHFVGDVLNDVFNAYDTTALVLNPSDILDGGAGDDTLNIVSTRDDYNMFEGSGGTSVALVTNVETVNFNIKSLGTGSSVDLRTWTGVKQINATVAAGTSGVTSLDFRAAPAPDVDVNVLNLGDGTLRMRALHDVNLNITGVISATFLMIVGLPRNVVITADHIAGDGSISRMDFKATGNIRLTQTASNAVGTSAYMSSATIGGGDTTSIVVHNAPAAVADGTHAGVIYSTFDTDNVSVAITDINAGTATVGVLSSIDLDGYFKALIKDSGLTTLKLAHGSGDVNIQNGSAAGAPTTLALTLNGVNGGALNDQGVYHTLNVTTGATASTLDNITVTALTALNVGGASNLTLTSTAGLTHLQAVTVTGAAGITADLSGASVTSVSTAASTGASTVTIAGGATFTGGAGADTVIYTTAPTTSVVLGGGDDVLDLSNNTGVSSVTLDGGAGTADVLRMNSSLASFTGQRAINFERLEIVANDGSAVDVGAMASAFHHVTVSGGGNPFLIGLDAVDTLVLKGAANSYALAFGSRSVVALQLTDSSGAGVNFTGNGITAPGLQTANITVTDGQATPTGGFMDAVNFQGNQLTTITVGGNAGLTLTAGSTALTSVDASGLTLGGFTWTAGNLGSAAIVKGSATGTNTLDFSATSHGVTYTGGTGSDIITVGGGANTIDVGTGSSVDKIILRPGATLNDFTTVNNLGHGDQIDLSGFGGVSTATQAHGAFSVPNNQTVEQFIGSLASSSDGSTAVLYLISDNQFNYYLYEDRSASSSFDPNLDLLVKLTGVSINITSFNAGTGLVTV